MQHALALFSLLFAVSNIAFASYTAPNFYSCKGNGITITYHASESPSFNLNKDMLDTMRTGDQITREFTSIGEIVSILDSAIPDAKTTHYSLVLPRINMTSGEEHRFETRLVKTDFFSTIAGPQIIHGLASKSQFTRMRCTASLVSH